MSASWLVLRRRAPGIRARFSLVCRQKITPGDVEVLFGQQSGALKISITRFVHSIMKLFARSSTEYLPFSLYIQDVELVKELQNLIIGDKYETILDFGSGPGKYARWLFEFSPVLKIYGIEPTDFSQEAGRSLYASHVTLGPVQLQLDITGAKSSHSALAALQDITHEKSFDLVYSFEVLEHIPRKHHCKILNFLSEAVKVGGIIIFSAAGFGQEGLGHISNRHVHDWRQDWLSRGFEHDPMFQCKLRSVSRFWFFRKNLLVFRKNSNSCKYKWSCEDKTCESQNYLPYENIEESRSNQEGLFGDDNHCRKMNFTSKFCSLKGRDKRGCDQFY